MANTATVYARIDPELKTEVEGILSQLGVTPSAVVQMLYSQIKLTRGIPFEIKLPMQKPLCIDDLTTEELNTELQKGFDSIQSGKLHTADEVDSILNAKLQNSYKQSLAGEGKPATQVFDSLEEEIKAAEITREEAMQAFLSLREQAAKNFPNGLSLEEINEEISKVRAGKAGKDSFAITIKG